MAILEKGLLAPRVDHYPREIASLRFNTLPSPYDFSSKINSLAIAVGSVGPVLAWKDGADLLCAALQIAESEEEFIRLEKLCLKLEEHLHKNSTTLLSALVYKAAVHVHSSSLRAAAERLDLTETEAFYRERQLRFQKESERQRLDKYDYATEKLLRERADLLTNLSMPPTRKILPDPPELTAEMLKPALRVERAVASRIFYSAFFIGLSLCGLIVWLRGRNRENPATFIPEIRILLFGSLLPFALLLIYRYFLSFGMLNFGGRSLTFWNYLLPEIAVFLILLVIPQVLMNKKTYPEHSFLRLWWPTGVAILGLLFASVMMHLLHLDYVAFILPGLFLTATLFWGLSQLRKPKPGFDRNGRIAPCYLLSATLCVLFIFGLVAEERFWFKQEGPHHASANGLTVFETETTEHLNEFVLQLRGPSRK